MSAFSSYILCYTFWVMPNNHLSNSSHTKKVHNTLLHAHKKMTMPEDALTLQIIDHQLSCSIFLIEIKTNSNPPSATLNPSTWPSFCITASTPWPWMAGMRWDRCMWNHPISLLKQQSMISGWCRCLISCLGILYYHSTRKLPYCAIACCFIWHQYWCQIICMSNNPSWDELFGSWINCCHYENVLWKRGSPFAANNKPEQKDIWFPFIP